MPTIILKAYIYRACVVCVKYSKGEIVLFTSVTHIQGAQSRRKLRNTVGRAQYSSQIAAVTVTVTARVYQR
jgi:hypothetical protein